MAVYTAIDNPELYMQVKLYTGTGSSLSVTLDGDEDMQPDMIWIKARNAQENHAVFDAVRGATKYVKPDETAAEVTDTNSLSAFNSDGFTVVSDGKTGTNARTYAAWNWKESATAGFDIANFTGNGSARTISHSLSAVPKMIITKNLNTTSSWTVYNHTVGATKYFYLNTNGDLADWVGHWNDTEPTSSVFTVGTDASTNGDGNVIVAYCFADVQGFSKFGSYTGNGNANGTFVPLSFRPAFILTKGTSVVSDWVLLDNKRNVFNTVTGQLQANKSDAESSTDSVDFLSNGFKVRNQYDSLGSSGNTYIYAAFAEAPFVNSNGVPCNAR